MNARLILLVLLFSIWIHNDSDGQTRNWTNTTSINATWHVPSNWSPAGAPSSSDLASFHANATYNVNFDSTTINLFSEVGAIDVQFGNVTFQSIETSALQFDSNGIFNVDQNSTVTIFGMHMSGQNLFIQNSFSIAGSHPGGSSYSTTGNVFLDQSSTDLNVVNGGVMNAGILSSLSIANVLIDNGSSLTVDIQLKLIDMIVNSGSSFFSNDLENRDTTILFEGPGTLWTEDGQLDSSISLIFFSSNAAGFWDSAFLELTNVSVSDAQLESDDVIELSNLSNITVANNGILRASSFVIPADCSIDLVDGNLTWAEMSYDDFSQIAFDADSFMNGGVSISGLTDLGTLPNLQSPFGTFGNVFLINRGILHRTGDVDTGLENLLGGEVRVESNQYLRFGDDIINEGDILMLGGTLESRNDLLNLEFVAGRGVIAAPLTCNAGTMAFSGPTDVLYDFENNGGLVLTSGNTTTTFFDDVNNCPGSEIRTSANSSVVFFGSLTGTGIFTGTGDVYVEGDLRPGNSPGQVLFGGNVFLGFASNSEFEFSGSDSGEFDQLLIDNDLHIAGNLTVTPLNGFQFEEDQEFIIAHVGGISSGNFDGLPEGSVVGHFNGMDLYITYRAGDGNDVALTTTNPGVLLGDVNLDGNVNLLDVAPFVSLISAGNFQAEADINQDGVVNLLDVQPFVGLLSS